MKRLISWFNIIIKKRRELKRWQRIVTVLAAVITFATTYALILPAITVETDTAEDVGGMYLEQAADPDSMREGDALEPTDVSITDDEENAEPYMYADAVSEEAAALATNTLEFPGSDYTVTLKYDETSGIPEGASLDVSEIAQESEEYAAYLDEARKAMGLTEEEALPHYAARFFDIKIMVDGQEFVPESGVSVEITYAEPLAENPQTEVNAVHFAEDMTATEVLEASSSEVQADGTSSVEFTAESFSVYGVIYTVDFHWEVDGNEYEYSLSGGDSVSFRELAEMLHVVDGDVLASAAYGMDDFIGDIGNIEFSDPSLVWAGKIQSDATAADIAEYHGLDVVYSAEMTDEQKAAIRAKSYKAGEWVIMGVAPFDTEETLTVTLKTGEIFSIKVTDAQIYRRYLSADGTSYDITVIYEDDAQIPVGAELDVREITPDSAEYQGYLKKSAEQLGEDSIRAISYARFFDIEIKDEYGDKVEPAAPVLVNIQYADATEIEAARDVHVVHFADDGTEVLEGIGVNQDGTVMTYLQDGFSVTGTVVNNPSPNDQYMVLIEYEGNYYIVNNDGSLANVGPSSSNTIEVDEPMMWTYDGRNIYHHSEQVSFNQSQLAADFYNKYIDPTDTVDGISKDQDNPGTTLRNINEQYFDWNTYRMRTFTYQVVQNRPQQNQTRITLSGDKLKSANSEQYLGVVEEDGVLKLKGGVSSDKAATVRLAQANQVLKTNYLNHTVNHIDISIEGEASVDVPLAYGTYYDANGNPIKEVKSNESLTLSSGVVGITMEDMKRAIITAYTKDNDGKVTEIDNAFVVNGYSANESTAYSTQQVRIEGEFRTSTIAPVTKSYYDSHREQVWQNRLNNRIYYKVTAYKTLTLNLIDPEVGQLYDENGKPLTVNVDFAFSSSFDFWDQRNECPPVQWDQDWLSGKGTIPDHNLSGMDFVLGANGEGNVKSRAVEIVKVVQDENGSPIEIKTQLQHSFELYRYDDVKNSNSHGDANSLRNQDTIWGMPNGDYAGTDSYNNYDVTKDDRFVHVQNLGVRVGTSGVGQSYIYDYNSGMFYIKEDKSTVPDTIIDANGETWYYASTVIDTEYVRRYSASVPDGSKTVHTSETYTDKEGDYASRAEVLGLYKTSDTQGGTEMNSDNDVFRGQEADNEFLEFTVHNVYKKTKAETTDLTVTKEWSEDREAENMKEVYVKIFRRTDGGAEEDFTEFIKNNKNALPLYFDSDPATNKYDYFDVENGWIVVKKGADGWDTVRVKNLPMTTEDETKTYTYYIREVGYKQNGTVFNNADVFNPEYQKKQTGDADWTDVAEDGIPLESKADGANAFKVINELEEPEKTTYTVRKEFVGSDAENYPTDGSVQVLVSLEVGYSEAGNTAPSEWRDAGVDVITLPRPYSENPDAVDSPTAENLRDWFASEAAWTYTWKDLNVKKKVNNSEVTLWYRAKEVSVPAWFSVAYPDNYGQPAVALTEQNAEELKTTQSTTITNSPQKYSLDFDKKWAKNGEETEEWPENVKVRVNAVRYWHLAELDNSTTPATLKLGKAFYSDQPGDTFFPDNGNQFTRTLDADNRDGSFKNLDAYAYVTVKNDENGNKLVVAAKEAGISLEKGRKYLIAYTYGANESRIFWTASDADGSPMNLIVPGAQDGNDPTNYTSHIVNELTDLTVKKQWRNADKYDADVSWPENAVVNYKIMRVPVYTTSSGRTIEFNDDEDTEVYLQKPAQDGPAYGYMALSAANFETGVKYDNLPMMGVKHLEPGNPYGLVSGDYLVSYRYYVAEDPEGSVAPENTDYVYSTIEAQVFNGVATLTNEYKNITVDKKWIRNEVEEPFPEGFKVNWTVVQKDTDGNVIDSEFYKAFEEAAGGADAHDNRLTKTTPSYTLKYLPAQGVRADGKVVEYVYEVVEEPDGSVAGEGNTYLFRPIKAEEESGEGSSRFTLINDLTKVKVKKVGDKGSSVVVQLYATTEKPSSLETVDVKVVLDRWVEGGALTEGTVNGRITADGETVRTFELKPSEWEQSYAGLPKYKADGKTTISYEVVVDEGPDGTNKAVRYNTTTDATGMTTFHLKAQGKPETVSVIVDLDKWTSGSPLKSRTVTGRLTADGVTLSDKSFRLTPDNWKQQFDGMPKYKYGGDGSKTPIVYGVTDISGPSIDGSGLAGHNTAEYDSTTTNNEGNETTIHLRAQGAAVTYNFTLIGDDIDIPAGVNVWVQVQNRNASGVWGNTLNLKDQVTTGSPKATIDLEQSGDNQVQFGVQGSLPAGYELVIPSGMTPNNFEGGSRDTNNETGEINIEIKIRKKTGPAADEYEVNYSVASWKQNTGHSDCPPPNSGYITFTLTPNGGTGSVKTVTLTGPDWSSQTIYLKKGDAYNVGISFSNNIARIEHGWDRYVSVNQGTNNAFDVVLNDSAVGQSAGKFSLRSLLKGGPLRANAAHADVTLEAPAESGTGEGEREINVIDKSNLPEGAVAVGDEVTLDANSTPDAWEHTWENLPKKDENGNDIYYYVVEKRATTSEPDVTSTTATYDIAQDPETGEFTVTITNTKTTEPPKKGTIVVEKKLEGVQKDDQKFQFSLQRTSGKYFKPEGTSGSWVDEVTWIDIYPDQKYTFTNLPLGNYVLKENLSSEITKITGYVLSAENSVTGTAGSGVSVIANGTSEFTFKNVYEPEAIRVTKEWQKADGTTMAAAPSGAKVTFHIAGSDGSTASDIVLDGTVDEQGETEAWVAEWKNLPRQTEDGTEITYTVTEVGGGWEHYKVTSESGVTYSDTDTTVNLIVNKEEVTQISVTKQWTGVDGQPVTDKSSIGFTLYQKYTDSAGETHSAVYTFAQKKVHDTEEPYTSLENGKGTVAYANGNWQTIDIGNLPKKTLGEDGRWYDASYYVAEDVIPDIAVIYKLGTGGSDKPEDAATQNGTITITNRNESTSLRIEKYWDDLGNTTPYEIIFTLQSKTTNGTWTDRGEYKLIFNGSTYTIENTAQGSDEEYDSNVITNLTRGNDYRVIEKSYTIKPEGGEEITKDLTDKPVTGTSETTDNGRTWTSRLENVMEKVGKIGGTKTWKDDKTNHSDPRLILERTVDNTNWEKVTALKMDPTVPAAAPDGENIGEESSEYTWLYPVWSTNSTTGLREYSYEHLPKYNPAGLEYTYRVTEAPTPGYSPIYSPESGIAENFTEQQVTRPDGTVQTIQAATVDIENQPVGRLKVKKTWFAGAVDEEMKTIEFKLERSTDPTDPESWTPVANASGTVGEGDALSEVGSDENGIVILEPQTDYYLDGDGNPTTGIAKTWEWISGNLPRYELSDSEYKPVYYRVKETKIGDTVITANETAGWTITNPEPVELTVSTDKETTIRNDRDFISLSGTKTWVTEDPDKIPKNLGLKIYRSTATWTETTVDGKTVKEYTDNDEKTDVTNLIGNTTEQSDLQQAELSWYNTGEGSKVWTYAYTNLPKYPANTQKTVYRYSVEEVLTGNTVVIDNQNVDLSELFTGETVPGQVQENGSIINWNFINTEKTSIKVIKKWKVDDKDAEGDPFDSNRKVMIEVFHRSGSGSASLGDFELTKEPKKIEYITDKETALEGANVSDWTLVVSGLPKYYIGENGALEEYSYYVVEQDTGNWHVEYSQEENGQYTMSANQMDARDTNSPIYVQNSMWLTKLPSTGGHGTRIYAVLGAILVMGAGMLLLKRRRFS